MRGKIHSIESFGTVDGPGIRLVVFVQGCPMRCLYCHNPDTWSIESNNLIDSDEIISRYMKNKEFYKDGGITVTGGEPLLQMDFLFELFSKAKKQGIHTTLDTSGILFEESKIEKFTELIKVTDLVLLDIKNIDPLKHKELCGFSNENVLNFAKFLDQNNVPVWIRHVVVDTLTNDEAALIELGKFIANLNNVKVLDVLPYHNMGEVKYKNLGIPYPLSKLSNLTKEEAIKAKNIILRAIKNERAKKNK